MKIDTPANNNQNFIHNDDGTTTKRNKFLAPFSNGLGLLKKHTNLTMWIVFCMIIGIIVGKFAPAFGVELEPMGRVFIRMIQTVVGPLIFSTLVIGIAGHGDDLARVGRLAVKSIVYFEVVTTFALIIGLLAVNIAKPGSGFTMDNLVAPDIKGEPITWVTEMENIVPQAFFKAMSDHSAVLAIVFCAVMFSVAIMRADEQSKKVMIDFNASLSNIMFKVVELIMNYAPIGIGCALAATVGKYGLGVLVVTGKLVGTLYATLIIFVILVILPVLLICRIPLLQFAKAVAPPFVMAFATASSESALPKAMENMIAFGCPWTAPPSTLPSPPCSAPSSKGVAAVPRASFIVLISTLSNANIPLAPLSLIMGVDAFMDMARTSVNVLGNMTACAVVSKWEGEFRNAEWQARQNGELIDTPAMTEVEVEQFSHIQHHDNHTMGGLHAEKASIRSTSSAVENRGSAQQRHTSGDQIV
ncbi:hypothetical protein BGX29_002228 [Mortierella sp. GBA35]|nr:hypothetical protein BGX29_002228 [Mortierella sp. GBA35]